jgi:hypothetical protein
MDTTAGEEKEAMFLTKLLTDLKVRHELALP